MQFDFRPISTYPWPMSSQWYVLEDVTRRLGQELVPVFLESYALSSTSGPVLSLRRKESVHWRRKEILKDRLKELNENKVHIVFEQCVEYADYSWKEVRVYLFSYV